jgi:hypothetical protein
MRMQRAAKNARVISHINYRLSRSKRLEFEKFFSVIGI